MRTVCNEPIFVAVIEEDQHTIDGITHDNGNNSIIDEVLIIS